jgi:hypothetical protein
MMASLMWHTLYLFFPAHGRMPSLRLLPLRLDSGKVHIHYTHTSNNGSSNCKYSFSSSPSTNYDTLCYCNAKDYFNCALKNWEDTIMPILVHLRSSATRKAMAFSSPSSAGATAYQVSTAILNAISSTA